jgi:uncharacterized membrane protein
MALSVEGIGSRLDGLEGRLGSLGELEPARAERLGKGLGWFSLALGTPQVLMPRRFARGLGLKGGRTSTALTFLVGVRELGAGAAILSSRERTPWLWSRVAGDAMDLTLLAAGLGTRRAKRGRLGLAIANVAGVMAADAAAAASTGRAEQATHVVKAVTVRRAPEEVYGFWRDFTNLPRFMAHLESVEPTGEGRSRWRATAPAGRTLEWDAEVVEDRPGELIAWRSLGGQVENSGAVRFSPAPGGRGTEVRVELDYAPPGGTAGMALARLFGEEPRQQVSDDLRRLKQVLEAGEVARSEGNPDGSLTRRLAKQRPAQPPVSQNGHP